MTYPLTPFQIRWFNKEGVQFIVLMNPLDFLKLTVIDDEELQDVMDIADTVSAYEEAATRKDVIPIFLSIDAFDELEGQAFNHEGRHRAAAAHKAGIGGITVALTLYKGGSGEGFERAARVAGATVKDLPVFVDNQDSADSMYEPWDTRSIVDFIGGGHKDGIKAFRGIQEEKLRRAGW